MNARLERIRAMGQLPFDLDFLREIGFTIGEDWDGEINITVPDDIPSRMVDVIHEFIDGIATRLHREGRAYKECFLGGPLNGQQHNLIDGEPYCHHIKRGQWAVYLAKQGDPRAWYLGTATSKEKGRQLRLVGI